MFGQNCLKTQLQRQLVSDADFKSNQKRGIFFHQQQSGNEYFLKAGMLQSFKKKSLSFLQLHLVAPLASASASAFSTSSSSSTSSRSGSWLTYGTRSRRRWRRKENRLTLLKLMPSLKVAIMFQFMNLCKAFNQWSQYVIKNKILLY